MHVCMYPCMHVCMYACMHVWEIGYGVRSITLTLVVKMIETLFMSCYVLIPIFFPDLHDEIRYFIPREEIKYFFQTMLN